MKQNKQAQKNISQVLLNVLTALTVLILGGGLIYIIQQHDLRGAWYASDVVAGGLGLWAAYWSTKQNPNVPAILIGAIFFFALGRIAQLMLL